MMLTDGLMWQGGPLAFTYVSKEDIPTIFDGVKALELQLLRASLLISTKEDIRANFIANNELVVLDHDGDDDHLVVLDNDDGHDVIDDTSPGVDHQRNEGDDLQSSSKKSKKQPTVLDANYADRLRVKSVSTEKKRDLSSTSTSTSTSPPANPKGGNKGSSTTKKKRDKKLSHLLKATEEKVLKKEKIKRKEAFAETKVFFLFSYNVYNLYITLYFLYFVQLLYYRS